MDKLQTLVGLVVLMMLIIQQFHGCDAGTNMCGIRIYDPSVSLCCNGNIRSRLGTNPACCGTESYDFDDFTKMCCDRHIISIPDSYYYPRCCGTRSYDGATNVCCEGQIRELAGQWHETICCGAEPYNRRTHTCCGGQLRHNDNVTGEFLASCLDF